MPSTRSFSEKAQHRALTHRVHRFRPTLTILENRAVPAVVTWDGGGSNNNWTTAANWVGDVAPIPGDDLLFPAGAQRMVNVNNFPANTTFGTLTVAALGYKLSGNTLSLTGGIEGKAPYVQSSPDIPTLQLGLALTGTPLTVTVSSGSVLVSGLISGSGGIIAKGGTLAISGANTYTGPTMIASGVLEVRSNAALGAIGTGNVTIISDGATLDLVGPALNIAEPIQFTGRGVKREIFASQGPIDAGAIANVTGTNTLSGPLTLTGDALIGGAPGSGNRVIITSGIGEVGGSHSLDIDVLGNGLEISKTAVNTLTGLTTVLWNVAINGQFVGPVLAAGSLSGTGTLGSLKVSSGSVDLSGPLTVGDLDLLSSASMRIGPQDHGRFIVNGSVKVAGFFTAATTVVGMEKMVKPGEVFRIIDNDGTDPVVGTFVSGFGGVALTEGSILPQASAPVPLRISYVGGDGNDVELIGVSQTASAAGAGPGGEARVNVYDGGGNLIRSFLAYPADFRGGVHVATVDVNNDSVPDIITGAGAGGGPLVRVFDGVTGAVTRQFYAYDQSFLGGVFVAAADIFPDQRVDFVTGAGAGGGPHVKVFDGATGAERVSFFAYDPGFRGGVSVAGISGFSGGHIFATGTIITGAGPGGGPHVRVFDIDGNVEREFFAYDPTFHGGVAVAYTGGIMQGLEPSYIATAPMSDGLPVVQVFNFDLKLVSSFFAYDTQFRGGVNIAVLPLGLNGANVIVTGAGPSGGPHLRQWVFPGPTTTRDLMAFDPGFTGGVFVG